MKLGFWLLRFSPARLLITGYLFIILAGFALLSIPAFQGEPTPLLDNLFIATSAVSTTGLTTVAVPDHYNFPGQLVIVILIQIGGIGFMSVASFAFLSWRGKLTLLQQNLSESDLRLPRGVQLESLVKVVVWFSLIVELAGATALYFQFRALDVPHPAWQAIFHSISAFCTAGFSLFNTGFEAYKHHAALNITIACLSLLGAIGFLVIHDLWQWLMDKGQRLNYTSRTILQFTLAMLVLGSLLIFFTEDSLQGSSTEQKLLVSVFQAMTALTTVGFNTVPLGELSSSVLFLLSVMMVMGASPSGTGGGIKSTSIVAAYAYVKSMLMGREAVTFAGKEIPRYRVRQALANVIFYVFVLCLGVYSLSLSERGALFPLIFEAASALGTVGLSMGITSDLTMVGKLVIIGLMFVGRIGPLSLGIAYLTKGKAAGRSAEEDLAV